MSSLPDPDRGALAFAERLMTVLAWGRKTATYKCAVLLGIMDLCQEHSTPGGAAPRRVATRQLAEKVVGLYWSHTVPFASGAEGLLRQNSGGRQAEILRSIRRFRDEALRDPSATLVRARHEAPEAFPRLEIRSSPASSPNGTASAFRRRGSRSSCSGSIAPP